MVTTNKNQLTMEGIFKHPLRLKFEEFDQSNPMVWDLFKQYTLEALGNGRRNLSVSLVIERIRWETTITTSDPDFKICNSYRAFYARKFHKDYPIYDGVFRTKTSVADL